MGYIGDNAIDVEPVKTDNLGSLAALMLADLPGCDDLSIRLKLGAALREFCRETNACTLTVPVAVQENGEVPMPMPPDGMVIGSILNVTASDGYMIRFEVVDGLRQKIVLRGASKGDSVLVKFSVYPKAGGEACPEWFIERYAEAIIAGAMSKLLFMNNRPWSDAGRATLYSNEYSEAISEASYRSLDTQLGGGAESAIPQGGLFL